MSGLIIVGVFFVICVVVCLSVYFTNSACSLGTWAGANCVSPVAATPSSPAACVPDGSPSAATPAGSDCCSANGVGSNGNCLAATTTPPPTTPPVTVPSVVPAAGGAVQTAAVSPIVPAAGGAVQTAAVSTVVPAAGAVQTAAVPPASALSGYTGPVTGFDYPYNDLGNWPTSDPNQCASYCASNPSCNMFVTATDSQNCWTKSAAQNKTANSNRNVYPKIGYTLP